MQKYVTVLLYLPEYYNPEKGVKGVKIGKEKYVKTAEELALNLSGGGTWHKKKTGIWWDDDIMYSDKIRILEIDIVDNTKNRNKMIEYVRKTLLERFKQKAIYIKFVRFVEPVVIKVEA